MVKIHLSSSRLSVLCPYFFPPSVAPGLLSPHGLGSCWALVYLALTGSGSPFPFVLFWIHSAMAPDDHTIHPQPNFILLTSSTLCVSSACSQPYTHTTQLASHSAPPSNLSIPTHLGSPPPASLVLGQIFKSLFGCCGGSILLDTVSPLHPLSCATYSCRY